MLAGIGCWKLNIESASQIFFLYSGDWRSLKLAYEGNFFNELMYNK